MDIKSMYLHVPFCKTICGYCDFCHFLYNKEKVDKWLIALKEELLDKDINNNLETIYIGGGTPTSLSINQLETLLYLIEPYSRNVIEYSIEINPETLTEEKVQLISKYGINRASIGLQSSDDYLLELMNRHHNFDMVKHCVELLKKYNINNISLDVMYGLPTQTLEKLEKTLYDVLSLDVSHISIYCLTIEPNTLFFKKGYTKVDEDLDADMYELINKVLSNNGFIQYEISNYCKKGYESKHNLTYWNYNDFYGISMGASGKEGLVRYDNTRDLTKYIQGIYVDNIISLNKEDSMFEYLMMGFRIKNGFSLSDFKDRYEVDFLDHYYSVLDELIEKKLIIVDDDKIKCSDYGFMICNDIIETFL